MSLNVIQENIISAKKIEVAVTDSSEAVLSGSTP